MKSETKVQYSLSLSKKRRTILIKMSDEGEVKVLAPYGTSKRKVEEVLLTHYDWIERRKSHLTSLDQPLPSHTYKDGDQFLLHNKVFTLKIEKNEEKFVEIVGNSIIVISPSISVIAIKKLIENYYDEYGLNLYKKLVLKWITELELTNTQYTISMTTYPRRLGSCSSQGVLSFARRTLMMPIELIDYLALHEVAHLVYFNHSRDFKKLLKYHMSDYKERFNKIKQLRVKIAHI